MKVKLSQIVPNKFRDLAKYPFSRVKIDGLKESTKDTGAWRNLMARPAGNTVDGIPEEELPAYLNGLAAAYDESGVPIFQVELAYGHHRWQAWLELGIEEIDIQVIPLDDKVMLQVMANENKGDWASNMSVILETVRQTREYLFDQVKGFSSYDDYAAAAGEDPFFTKEQFAQIPEQGIGFKTVRKFLGETWAEGDIRNAMATLKAIDAGLYEQEQVVGFSSVGVLGAFTKVAEGIKNQAWPEYFKRKAIDDIAKMVADPNIGTTVKTLKSAQAAVNEGKDPVRVVKNPGHKRQDFDVVKAIKDLVYENGMIPEAERVKIEDIPEMDGFKDFPELDKILLKVRESIQRSEAAKAGAASKTGTVAEDNAASPMDQAELDKTVADAEASAAAGVAPTAGTVPPLPEVGGEDVVPVEAIIERFTSSVPVMAEQITALGERLGDIEDESNPVFGVIEKLFIEVSKLYVGVYDVQTAVLTIKENCK